VSALTKIVIDHDEVVARLAELGLPSNDDIHRVLRQSDLSRSTCTRLDPRTFRGMMTWGTTVRYLRAVEIPNGWTAREEDGLSLTVAPDRERALLVATGSTGTGQLKGRPKTRSPKGKKTVEAINAQALQLALAELLGPEPAKDPKPEIWFLLYRHARRKNGTRRIYAEISRPHPDGISKRGRISGWAERIILERIDLDGGGMVQRPPESGPQFDVDIARRAG
jgi:hypothetical protein